MIFLRQAAGAYPVNLLFAGKGRYSLGAAQAMSGHRAEFSECALFQFWNKNA
jgi:hypothetical protein